MPTQGVGTFVNRKQTSVMPAVTWITIRKSRLPMVYVSLSKHFGQQVDESRLACASGAKDAPVPVFHGARCIASVDDQTGVLDNPFPVVGTVIGGNQHAVHRTQILRGQLDATHMQMR